MTKIIGYSLNAENNAAQHADILLPCWTPEQMMEKQEKAIREEKKARDAVRNAVSSSASSSSPQEITIIPNTSHIATASSELLQPLSDRAKLSESLEVETRDKDNMDSRKWFHSLLTNCKLERVLMMEQIWNASSSSQEQIGLHNKIPFPTFKVTAFDMQSVPSTDCIRDSLWAPPTPPALTNGICTTSLTKFPSFITTQATNQKLRMVCIFCLSRAQGNHSK